MGRIISIVSVLVCLASVFYYCSKDTISGSAENTALIPRVIWKKGDVAVTPDEVDSVKITIKYDATSIVKTFPFTADTGTFGALPTGSIIMVTLEGLDANSIVVYRGIKDSILLVGDWVEVVIEAHELTPLAPDSLNASVISSKTVQLTWQDKSSNEIKFLIQRKIGTGTFDSIAAVAQDQESFTDTGLTAVTAYTYRVYTQNSAGNSLQYAESPEVTTPDTGTNTKPYFVDATINSLKDDTLNVNERYARYMHAQDDDGDTVTYSASAQLTIIGDSIQWTPTINDTGFNYFWVKADDGKGLYDSLGWKLFVADIIQDTTDSSLVAYYPFSGNAKDKSGNGNHGIVYGVSLTNDRFDNGNSAYSFDGIDDYIDIGNSEDFDFDQSNSKLSISTWIKLSISDYAGMRIISKYDTLNNQRSWSVGTHYIKPFTILSPDGGYINRVHYRPLSGDTLMISKWYHVIYIIDIENDIFKIFINATEHAGEHIANTSIQSIYKSTVNVNVLIGAYHAGSTLKGEFFNGVIDDIHVFSRILTENEIDSLYHLGGWPINQAPQFTHDSTEMTDSAIVGIEYKDTVHAVDIDGDVLTFSFIDSVEGMLFTDSIISWISTKVDTGIKKVKVKVADGNGLFDSLNWNIHVIDTSDTGCTFELVTDSAGFMYPYAYQPALFMGEKLWLIGQKKLFKWKNEVWSSEDGKNWTKILDSIPFMGRDNYACVSFQDKLWIIGGGQNGSNLKTDVWYSSDGITWIEATNDLGFTQRHRHSSTVFDNKIWVACGGKSGVINNDVWYSEDGISWIQATGNAGFKGREMATFIAYNNKLWIMGGYHYLDDEHFNDVWYSSDGITWTPATDSADFTIRKWAAGTSYDNKMWISGGNAPPAEIYHDVWFSTDGVNWTELTGNAEFPPRMCSSMLTFGNKLWVIGGVTNPESSLNDVWCLK